MTSVSQVRADLVPQTLPEFPSCLIEHLSLEAAASAGGTTSRDEEAMKAMETRRRELPKDGREGWRGSRQLKVPCSAKKK